MVGLGNLLLSKFLMIYLFGALIIILYAKDKFNMPTYDKDAMGPFAQLSPQQLTIDARYQWGRTVYVVLMLCLYTAISVVGPASFSNLMAGAGTLAAPIPNAGGGEVWPVAAAAFLISTGAANDNNVLGRLELLIRQYAQRSAYIPTTVSDLAFTLRTVNIRQWLIANPHIDEAEFRERQKSLAGLVGADNIEKIKETPSQEGQLAAWVRANILFYTLQQIFNKRPSMSSAKLDYLTDLPENVQIFEGLKAKRETLLPEFKSGLNAADYDTGKVFADVQRFSKETSLMIAVLLSQTARNTSYLTEHLDRLGFQGVDLRDRSDHFTYTVLVYAFITAGSIVLATILAIAALPGLAHPLNWMHNVGVINGAITIFSGTVVYLVVFKATDYCRERLLDTLVWREDLESYVKLTLKASFISCSASIVLLVLVLSLFNVANIVINGPVALAQLFLFQLVIAALGTAFGLVYLRQAARLPKSQLSLSTMFLNYTAVAHGLIAAIFVGALNMAIFLFNVGNAPKDAATAVQATWTSVAQDSKAGFAAANYPKWQLADITKMINAFPASLDRMEFGNAKAQLDELYQICDLLNAPRGPDRSSTLPAGTTGADATQDASAARLFVTQGTCTPHLPIAASDEANSKNPRLQFASLLGELQAKLSGVNGAVGALYFVLTFPTLAAFLIAYCFGIACRYWRAWWLNNDVDYLSELKGEIRAAYGGDLDTDKCLTWPVGLLGDVTPIEAVRYEDYRAKLLANVQRQRVDWPQSFYRSRAAASDDAAAVALGTEPDASSVVRS